MTPEQQREQAQAIAQDIERQLDAELAGQFRTVDDILRYYDRQV